MAVITPTMKRISKALVVVNWGTMTEVDTAAAADLSAYGYPSSGQAAIAGGFGTAINVELDGSADGVTFTPLLDSGGPTTIDVTAAANVFFDRVPRFLKPTITAGTGGTITVEAAIFIQ